MKELRSLISPSFVVISAVFLRLVPHQPNVAPIAAMALFGGAHLPKKYALIIPPAAMLISDFFIGFHSTMIWVYASFLMIGLIGLYLRKHLNLSSVILASLLGSLLFYLITNFGVWVVGGMYPKTLSGLLQSYTMALPFFRNTLLGDLFFNSLFFGSYYLVTTQVKNYLTARAD